MRQTLPEPTAEEPGRGLVPAAVFARLVGRIVADHGLDQPLAERVMTETVAFLRAAAAAPTPIWPSRLVDAGWHTFILDTGHYAQFCRRVAGRFLHHVPGDVDLPADDGAAHRRLCDTIAALTAVGHHVDVALWAPTVPGQVSDHTMPPAPRLPPLAGATHQP